MLPRGVASKISTFRYHPACRLLGRSLGLAAALWLGTPEPAWTGQMTTDPKGFFNMAWGRSLAENPDLMLVEDGEQLRQYELKRGPFMLGDAEVDVLKFGSIEDQFARVTVRYHGQRTHEKVLQYLQAQFGPIERIPGSMLRGLSQQFNWRGPHTEVNLTYDRGQERGFVFIESRTLAPRFNDSLPEHAF